MTAPPLQIGIVACSAEGAALCYRTCAPRRRAARAVRPPRSVAARALLRALRRVHHRGDWAGVAELMLDSARKLAATGARFLICPDNTIHQAFPFLEGSGRRCPGSTSRRWWRPRRCGAGSGSSGSPGRGGWSRARCTRRSWPRGGWPGCVRTRSTRLECGRIIMEELVNGRFLPEGCGPSRRSSGGSATPGATRWCSGARRSRSSSRTRTRRCRRSTRRGCWRARRSGGRSSRVETGRCSPGAPLASGPFGRGQDRSKWLPPCARAA